MRDLPLAFDQLVNTMVYIKGDGWGCADESLSARSWRLRTMSAIPYRTINAVFFWQKNHCQEAYESEMFKRQLPSEYRL